MRVVLKVELRDDNMNVELDGSKREVGIALFAALCTGIEAMGKGWTVEKAREIFKKITDDAWENFVIGREEAAEQDNGEQKQLLWLQ